MGLPGNPVSSFVVFQLFAAPLIRALQGAQVKMPKAIPVRSNFNKAAVSREEYVRVRLAVDESGLTCVERYGNLSSGVLSSISWADGLVKQNVNHAICAGGLVDFFPLRNSSLW
jgi:molybdopterin molybdotransferase